eukprot:762958-Hanusia_phi.AAC.6
MNEEGCGDPFVNDAGDGAMLKWRGTTGRGGWVRARRRGRRGKEWMIGKEGRKGDGLQDDGEAEVRGKHVVGVYVTIVVLSSPFVSDPLTGLCLKRWRLCPEEVDTGALEQILCHS